MPKTKEQPKAAKLQRRKPLRAAAGSARALAATIAAALFTSGDGKRASRLHFILESGEVWGGWSEPAAANHIAEIIEAHNIARETTAGET